MKGLLVVDIQNDFCLGGSLEVRDSNSIIPIVNNLIEYFNEKKLFITATMDWHPKNHGSFASNSNGNIGELGKLNGLDQIWWPNHCIQDTFGARLHSDLNKINNIVYKGCDPSVDSYSGFFDNGRINKTNLDELLRSKEIDDLYIVGLATDYCVKYTVLDALSLGYNVNLVVDACRGVNINPTDTELALNEMEEKGAKLVTSKEVLK